MKEVYWLDEFTAVFGPSRPSIYREIKSGRLKVIKIGRRTAITRIAALAWIRLLEKTTEDNGGLK